ncbi:MAG TPA: FHA domain-containing protein [Candidatus Thermoplasmatota archaeon]|nr:FHA domain-containing protein [Candidatus Thermoplasmatota archaeon]
MVDDAAATERLMMRLRALASPVRLQLLKALVTPSRSADVRVRAAGERAGLGAERFLGRSTVIEHLDVLMEAGLVRRIGDSYVTDQQAMVALLQDLGELARLRALVEVDVEVTRAAAAPAVQPLPHLPRALVANGPDAGRAFALTGSGPWRVGRGADCELSLPHDPHVSRLHVTLELAPPGFLVRVASAAKNAVFVDFAQLPPGESLAVRPGALLLVGATLLALQA